MSKAISIQLVAEMTGKVMKLATCMKITRTDNTVYGFTTYDKELVIDGVYYEPAASFNPSDIASSNTMDVDNLNVEGVLDSDTITEDELRAGRWDYAAFRIFQVNYSDLTQGDKKDRAGHLGEVTVHRQTFVAELMGMMEAYTISVGDLTQPMCRTSLGSSLCKFGLGSPNILSVSGTITLCETDFFTLTDTSRTEQTGTFDEGVITFTSGLANGLSYEVKAYVLNGSPNGGLWITKTPVAYDVTGATYTMSQGCNRLFTTCRDTFNNVINFRGEPWLRGNDTLVQVGRHT